MNLKIKILIAEHEISDIELICNELKRGGVDFFYETAKTEKEFRGSIKKFIPDLILSDYAFPHFSGDLAFSIREELAPLTPFIIVSGTIGEETSVEMIKQGISDYVLKDKLFALVPKVRRALKESNDWKEKEAAQKQLVLREAQLAEAQAIAKTGSWITELSDLSVKWSRETFRIFDMKEHSGFTTHAEFLERVHPEDRTHVSKAFKNSMDTFSINTFQHRIITQAGELKFVEENWKILRDDQGIPLRAIGSCQEITERKQTEEQREFERTNLANAQRLAHMGSWDYNIQSNKISWSEALYHVFDVDRKTFKDNYESFFELINENDRNRVEEVVRYTKKTGDPFTIEYSISTPSGEKRDIREHGYGKKDKTGKVIHLFGTAQDITETKKSALALKKAYDEKNDVLESIDDGFFATDSNSVVTYWNKRAEILLSMKKEDMLGKNLHEMFADRSSPVFYDHYIRALSEKITLRFEAFSTRSNYWFAVSAFGSEDGLSVYFKDITERKNAEEKLKETELRYRSKLELERQRFIGLYSQAPSCMGILKGPNHVFELANPLYLQLIQKSDIIGKTIKEVLPEMESQGFLENLDNVYETGDSFSANEKLVKFDYAGSGKMVDTYLNFMYQAHRDPDGDIVGIFFFVVDVTEQVLSRKKIEASEKRYRQIVETAQEGIWLIDEDNKTTFVNSKMCEILKYSQEEMMGKDIFFFMDEEGKQIAADLMEKKKLGEAGQANFKYLDRTGEVIWTNVSANPLFYEDGTYQGSLAMVTDITQSKKAEKKDKFQAALLNTIGQATIATDMQGTIIFWNQAASTIYGWREEEVLGKNILQITPGKQTEEQAKQIMQELLLGKTWSGEFIVRRKDGSEFPAFVTNAPIYGHQQQLIGIIGVSSDITRRKQAELNLKESNERYKISEIQLTELNANLQMQTDKLAISNADLEQFAYVASHDLQEPLRMVTSFLTQLQKKYGTVIDDKGKQYIEFAVDGARRMRQIILDLLEFSRVGRTEDLQEDIDLNDIIDEIKVLFRKQIMESKAVIISQSLPVVFGYRSPLRQVFQNLISNALKYSKKDRDTRINISYTEIKDHWQFAVSDNGIGIEKEYYDKIFIIFQRLHNKNEFSGTGMGLAVTKKIIESFGGKIRVESEEDKGSTFYFTIPKKMM